jgi:outer membrane immunogenic protein
MVRITMIAALSAAIMASPALAADIYKNDAGSLKDTPYTPAFSWTGFYLGANVGYAWGDVESRSDEGFEEDDASVSYDADGVLAGAQIGYNVQRGRFVFGVEGELGWLGGEGDKFIVDDPDNFGEAEFGAYGVLAARIGIASERALFYVKGGWALANVDLSAGDLDSGDIDEDNSTSVDETLSGYAIGGGVEYALSQNWTVKAEYLYMNFGEEKSRSAEGESFEHEIDLHTAKIGVNYKFGGGHEALK